MTLRAMPLRFCRFLLQLLLLWPVGSTAQTEAAPASPLTSSAAVRALSAKQASEGWPVRLRGKLLLITTHRNALVLLDETEGIYVGLGSLRLPAGMKLGDELEVTGVSGAGDFAPIVQAQKIARIGPGTLPPPRATTITELNAGGFDAAWISLRGIVRSCAPSPPDRAQTAGRAVGPDAAGGAPVRRWVMMLAQGDDKLEVQINGPVVPRELVDAEVLLRGVVLNVHNANRQFVRANLQVANRGLIEVVAPPPGDPFALPVQPLGEVLRFSRGGFTGHRIHLRGTVIGHKDGNALWLQEAGRGMQIASAQKGDLVPGDRVDVVGFPDHGSYTPTLSDAEFVKIASGPAPVAQRLDRGERISQFDANLVEIEAELRELRRGPDGVSLRLEWQGREVYAHMPAPAREADFDAWKEGSGVRVTGVCVTGQKEFLRPSGLWVAGDLQLWLRGPDDVAVVRPAPWLTTRRALNLAIMVAAVMLLALIVVAVSTRRQIRQREAARRLAEAEFAAMLAERNRLAREFHDTLAQDLNAVSMQLELAKNSAKLGTPERLERFVAAAHQIVRQCLAEARESIWDMRSHILEKTDLPGALRTVAEQLRGGVACAIVTRVKGAPRRLAPNIENNLLRIGQEAVSNALKHAKPRTIELELSFEGPAVALVVSDDGPGFDPERAEAGSDHFGLQGMRERVAQMNGVLHIGRRPRGGARVAVSVNAPEPV